MAADDSDSDLEDVSDYTETNVLLGYASKERVDDSISHLGGYPTWLEPHVTPPAALARCKVCNGYMSLLLQLNGDLPKYFPDDERRLHLLCCRRKPCSRKVGSVRAFREVERFSSQRHTRPATEVQLVEQTQTRPTEPAPDLGAALFGATSVQKPFPGTNPFSTSPAVSRTSATAVTNALDTSHGTAKPTQPPRSPSESPLETLAQKLQISTPAAPNPAIASDSWPGQSKFPKPFTHLYLDADYEVLAPEPAAKAPAGPSKSQYDADDSKGNGMEKDTFESSLDTTFLRFSDRQAQNPEQVLRYEFKGQPLLYSGTDDVASRFIVPHGKAGAPQGIPRCDTCGAPRVFELQLVPGAIAALEADEEIDLDHGMDWGTIILGVCEKNCAEAGTVVFREEWVGVQWEERLVT